MKFWTWDTSLKDPLFTLTSVKNLSCLSSPALLLAPVHTFCGGPLHLGLPPHPEEPVLSLPGSRLSRDRDADPAAASHPRAPSAPRCCGTVHSPLSLGATAGSPGSNSVQEKKGTAGQTLSLSVFVVQALPFPSLNLIHTFLFPVAAEAPACALFKKKKPLIFWFVLCGNPFNSTAERGPKIKAWKGNIFSTHL